MIVDGEGQFKYQDFLIFSNQFRTKYDQLVEAKNSGQCAMVLAKNVTITIVSDRFLQTQPYAILSRVVDDNVKAQLLQVHTKLIGHQLPMREVIYSYCFFNPLKVYISFTIGSLMNFFSFLLDCWSIIYIQYNIPSSPKIMCKMSCAGYCCCIYK